MLSRDSCNPSSGCAWRYNKCTKSTSAPKLSSRVIPKFPAYHFLQMTPLPQLQQPIRRIQATVSTVMKKRRKIARPSTALAPVPAPASAPAPVSSRMPQLRKPIKITGKRYAKTTGKRSRKSGKTTIIYYPRSRSRSPFRQERRVLQTRLLQQLVKYNSRKEASAVRRKIGRRMAGTSLALSKRVQKLQKLLKGKRRRRSKTLPLTQLMQQVPEAMQQQKKQQVPQTQQQQKKQQVQQQKKQQKAQQAKQQQKAPQTQEEKKQQKAQQQKKKQQAQQVQPSLSPEIIAQGLQQQRSRAPEIQVQQQTTSSKPVIIQQQGRKPATTPIIIQQQERRSKTAPIIIQQQERRSKTAPIIIQQQERRSKSAPIIIQQQRRSSSSPVYVSSLGHSVPGFLLSPGMPGYPMMPGMMPGMMPAYPGMPPMFARQQEKYRKAFEQEMKKLEKARAELKEKQQRAKRAGDEAAFKRAKEQLRRKEQESKRTIAQVERRANQLAKKEKQMELQRRKMEINTNALIQDINRNTKLSLSQKDRQIKKLKDAAAAEKGDILRRVRQAAAVKNLQGIQVQPRNRPQRPPPPRPTGPKSQYPPQRPSKQSLINTMTSRIKELQQNGKASRKQINQLYNKLQRFRNDKIPSTSVLNEIESFDNRMFGLEPKESTYDTLKRPQPTVSRGFVSQPNPAYQSGQSVYAPLKGQFRQNKSVSGVSNQMYGIIPQPAYQQLRQYTDIAPIPPKPYLPSQQVTKLKAQILQLSKRPTPQDIQKLQEQLSAMEAQLVASSAELEALRKAAAGSPAAQAVTAVSKQLEQAAARNAELKGEIQKLQTELEGLKTALTTANQQGAKTKSQLQASKRVSKQMANVNARFNQLNRLHAMMEVDFAGMANKLTKTQARRLKQAQEFQRKKTEMTFSAEDIAGKLKEYIERNKTLETNLQEKEQEMKDRIKELETAIKELQSAPSPAIEPLNLAQNAAAVQEQSKKKDSEINRLMEELAGFQEDLKNLHSSNDDHKKARQEAEKKVSGLQQALSALENTTSARDVQKSQLDSRNADLQKKLTEATKTVETLKKENSELVKDLENIEPELGRLNADLVAARNAAKN